MKNKMRLMVMVGIMSICIAGCGGNAETGKESSGKKENQVSSETTNGDVTDSEDTKDEDKKEPGILKSKKIVRVGVDYTDYYEYDKNGYQIKYIRTYVADGYVSSHIEYVYDEKGNLLEEHPIVSDDPWSSHIAYEYDEQGNLLKQFHFTEDGQKQDAFREYIYTFDEHNNIVSTTAKDYLNDTTSITTTENTYDENNRRVFAITKNEKGKPQREFEWSYYESGEVKQYIERWCAGVNMYTSVVITDYDEAGRVVKEKSNSNIQEWVYSEEGYLLSEKTYNDEEGSYEEYKYTYDADGKILTKQTLTNREGAVYCTLKYEYDESGRLAKVAFLDKNNYERTFTTYEYDENDNVIKENEQTEKEVFTTIEYTYYE